MLRVLPIVFLCIFLIATVYVLSSEEKTSDWEKRMADLRESYEYTYVSPDESFVFIQEIVSHFIGADKGDEMIVFLGKHIRKAPGDKNNAYYLSLIASQYMKQNASDIARLYYIRAINNPDVYIDTTSVHYYALQQLIDMEQKPFYKIRYLNYLANSFADEIKEPGLLYYTLGENYSMLSQWDKAYNAYTTFLHLSYENKSTLPFYNHIQRWVALYESSRDWTVANLDTLVSTIKQALYTKNIGKLLGYRAKKNFFTMSWNQESFDKNSQIATFNVGAFLRRSTVRFSQDLERSSNDKEAYLRTWGWSHRIPVWYLYFRKIDFEVDPLINGNWEWAGIFFGDSL